MRSSSCKAFRLEGVGGVGVGAKGLGFRLCNWGLGLRYKGFSIRFLEVIMCVFIKS